MHLICTSPFKFITFGFYANRCVLDIYPKPHQTTPGEPEALQMSLMAFFFFPLQCQSLVIDFTQFFSLHLGCFQDAISQLNNHTRSWRHHKLLISYLLTGVFSKNWISHSIFLHVIVYLKQKKRKQNWKNLPSLMFVPEFVCFILLNERLFLVVQYNTLLEYSYYAKLIYLQLFLRKL